MLNDATFLKWWKSFHDFFTLKLYQNFKKYFLLKTKEDIFYNVGTKQFWDIIVNHSIFILTMEVNSAPEVFE